MSEARTRELGWNLDYYDLSEPYHMSGNNKHELRVNN